MYNLVQWKEANSNLLRQIVKLKCERFLIILSLFDLVMPYHSAKISVVHKGLHGWQKSAPWQRHCVLKSEISTWGHWM